MILGLTLLTANLRGPIEIFIVYLLFFWEKKSMRALLKKNLIAHKATNKLTSIIYALTLGCVIFLCVSLNLVLKSATGMSVTPGLDIQIESNDGLNITELDTALLPFSSSIKEHGYVSVDLR